MDTADTWGVRILAALNRQENKSWKTKEQCGDDSGDDSSNTDYEIVYEHLH